MFKKHVGSARWVYNWYLSEYKKQLESKDYSVDLGKKFLELKRTEEYKWLYEVSACSLNRAFTNCRDAFKDYFKKRCKFPNFKSKHRSRQSYWLQGCTWLTNTHIKIPNIGLVRIKEKNYLDLSKRIISATISGRADRWFVSCIVEEEIEELPKNTNVVGVDLGIKHLAITSNREYFKNPKALRRNLKKLKRVQRQHSRKQKGSRNRERSRKKIAKTHYRISNIRKDALHKATTKIIRENQVIVLEDLKFGDMGKSLNRNLRDASFGMFRGMIEYKARWYGREIVIADKYFPSTKKCSNCGVVGESLDLSQRMFTCFSCSFSLDRDLNAAMNLKHLHTVGSTGIQACGDRDVLLSMKQEVSTEISFSG